MTKAQSEKRNRLQELAPPHWFVFPAAVEFVVVEPQNGLTFAGTAAEVERYLRDKTAASGTTTGTDES